MCALNTEMKYADEHLTVLKRDNGPLFTLCLWHSHRSLDSGANQSTSEGGHYVELRCQNWIRRKKENYGSKIWDELLHS